MRHARVAILHQGALHYDGPRQALGDDLEAIFLRIVSADTPVAA